MPNLNSLEPGDNVYPDRQVFKYQPIGTNVAITKGHFYTKKLGYLVEPTQANNFFLNGCYQAAGSIAADAGADGKNRVQCLGVGSRVLVEAKVALETGIIAKYDAATDNIEQWVINGANPTRDEMYNRIGYIFEVYTKDSITTEKESAAIGDKVILEIGSGQA